MDNNMQPKNLRLDTATNMIYQWLCATIPISIEHYFRVNALKGVSIAEVCIAFTFSVLLKANEL